MAYFQLWFSILKMDAFGGQQYTKCKLKVQANGVLIIKKNFADTMDSTNSYIGNCKRQLTKHGCLQANAKDGANVINL